MKDLSNINNVLGILTDNGGRLSEQMKKSASNGNIRIYDSFNYVNKQIVPGGTLDLVDSETKRVNGVSSFQGTQFPNDRVEIIDRIKIGYQISDKEGQEGALKYDKALTSLLSNSTLKITQGSYFLGEYPLEDLSNKYTGNKIDDDYLYLKNPVVIVGGVDFTIELIAPKDVKSTVADFEYLRFVTSGVQVVKNLNK